MYKTWINYEKPITDHSHEHTQRFGRYSPVGVSAHNREGAICATSTCVIDMVSANSGKDQLKGEKIRNGPMKSDTGLTAVVRTSATGK